ncbi:MFS transporter [Streptomyces sp. RFCAC02]|uniref:MFS transporter n=1 Tax=Streptomyces sp. RFCAC02 TaxID=2499143 RepID=UPI001020200C|nr:MFS transporter [Streptomyces sp. RFCAC02]
MDATPQPARCPPTLAQGHPVPARRARIIGLRGAVTALAVVLGPLLGGLLTDTFGRPAVFLVNLPLGAVVLLPTPDPRPIPPA